LGNSRQYNPKTSEKKKIIPRFIDGKRWLIIFSCANQTSHKAVKQAQ